MIGAGNRTPEQVRSTSFDSYTGVPTPLKKKSLVKVNPHSFDFNRNLFERDEVEEQDTVTNFEELGLICIRLNFMFLTDNVFCTKLSITPNKFHLFPFV